MTSSTKLEVHNIMDCRREDQATATGDKYEKYGEIWACGF